MSDRLGPVDLRVLIDHCQAVVETMAVTLYRTAHSTFVKETEDFTVGIVTPEGETFSCPRNFGATWFAGLDYGPVIRRFAHYAEGDICITSDPYAGSVSTHSPDLHMWKPVFCGGEIVCFVVGHVHNTDVGGAVPASLSRTLVDVQQEGIRIPPTKLYEAGRLNQVVVDILLTNVRAPQQNWGDLKALVSAINTGEAKARDLAARFGAARFRAGSEQMLDYAERQSRALIRDIADGTYSFHDYLDEDGVGGRPCRLAASMIVAGDSISFDFSRSDPQVASSLNVPTGGHERHALLLIAVYYVFFSLQPDMLMNGGLIRPIRCHVPRGSILNPEYPAAVGLRSLTALRLQDVVLGCLFQALPQALPTASSGSVSILNVLADDPRTGRRVIAAIAPVVGGGGAWLGSDGSEGAGGNAGYLKNTPVEINEAEVPIQVLGYRLLPNSGGAGTFRGGLGVALDVRILSEGAVVTARNRDRTRFAAWGATGGRAGQTSSFTLNPGTPRERDLGNDDLVTVSSGDVLRITSSGGGGWGDPFERDPERVIRDVRAGFVSVEAALELHGVVIAAGRIDEAATRAARSARLERSVADFDFGPGRDVYEAHLPPGAYDALLSGLGRMLPASRAGHKRRVLELVDGEAVVTPARIEAVLDAVADGEAQAMTGSRGRSATPELTGTSATGSRPTST